MNYAENWTSVTAGNIANVDTPGYTAKEIVPPASGDVTTGPAGVANTAGPTDLAVEIPNLMLSQVSMAANVAAMNTVTEMYKSILKLGESE